MLVIDTVLAYKVLVYWLLIYVDAATFW